MNKIIVSLLFLSTSFAPLLRADFTKEIEFLHEGNKKNIDYFQSETQKTMDKASSVFATKFLGAGISLFAITQLLIPGIRVYLTPNPDDDTKKYARKLIASGIIGTLAGIAVIKSDRIRSYLS